MSQVHQILVVPCQNKIKQAPKNISKNAAKEKDFVEHTNIISNKAKDTKFNLEFLKSLKERKINIKHLFEQK